MSHPAEVPIQELLALIPKSAHITGLWVQNPSDKTCPAEGGPVRISIQWSYGGYADGESGDGSNVRQAGSRLLSRMRERFPRGRYVVDRRATA